ncbi:MAG: hypothetical protein NC393_01215 [Clostridium sp.]|nr:hypothetical protein [Clostridium sp.]MCM1170722.1 hypothetical protein [Clostridium sp.]MCM1209886.1 hypothetical protein [Ruminococcus sp.]
MKQDTKERVQFFRKKISDNNVLIDAYKAQVEVLDECINKLNAAIEDIEDAFVNASFLSRYYIDEELWYGAGKADFEEELIPAYESSAIHFRDAISGKLEAVENKKRHICCEIANLEMENFLYNFFLN